MKLKIQNLYTVYLPDRYSVDERHDYVKEILQNVIVFENEKFTVESYFDYTWDKPNTRTCLDILGTYLSKQPKQNGSHDPYVLTAKQDKEMKKGIYKGQVRYVNHSCLSEEDKYYLGIHPDNK